MSQSELLREVVEVLDRFEIAFMLTGSFASSFQGEPRSSHDIDLVVELDSKQIESLLTAFLAPRFYLSRIAIEDALRHHKMFTLQEIETGDKVDFWILKRTPFDQSRFGRRQKARVHGVDVSISAAEDTILQKLRWAVDCGGSEKQFGDAKAVFEVQNDVLDRAYLDRWVGELGVETLWARLLDEAR